MKTLRYVNYAILVCIILGVLMMHPSDSGVFVIPGQWAMLLFVGLGTLACLAAFLDAAGWQAVRIAMLHAGLSLLSVSVIGYLTYRPRNYGVLLFFGGIGVVAVLNSLARRDWS